MERFIENLFNDESICDNFIYNWINTYQDQFNKLVPQENSEEKKQKLINSLKIFITKANQLKRYYPNTSIIESLSLEEALFKGVEGILSCLDIKAFTTTEGLNLLEHILTNKRMKFLMGRCFSLVSKELQYAKIIENFSVEQCNKYLKLLEIEFYPLYENEENSEALQKQYEKFGALWRFVMEGAIEKLNEKQFLESLPAVQHLYK